MNDKNSVQDMMSSQNKRYIALYCWHNDLLSPGRLYQLLSRHTLDIQSYLNAEVPQIRCIDSAINLGQAVEHDYTSQQHCHLICCSDPEYPSQLLPFSSTAPILSVRGSTALLSHPQAALVGSRELHALSPQLVEFLGDELMLRGYLLTSGGAKGIDAAAHRQAMLRERPTIVIAGTGLSRLYPSENKDIFEYAENYGAVVSQFPRHFSGKNYNFPTRNAIIAGLSDAVIVVQSRERGGALYTAEYASRLNRPVGVPSLPGFCHLTEGGLMLVKKGKASLITNAADIDALLPPLPSYEIIPPYTPPQPQTSPMPPIPPQSKMQQLSLPEDMQTPIPTAIIHALAKEQMTRENLRRAAAPDDANFDEALLELELRGIVILRSGQYTLSG